MGKTHRNTGGTHWKQKSRRKKARSKANKRPKRSIVNFLARPEDRRK